MEKAEFVNAFKEMKSYLTMPAKAMSIDTTTPTPCVHRAPYPRYYLAGDSHYTAQDQGCCDRPRDRCSQGLEELEDEDWPVHRLEGGRWSIPQLGECGTKVGEQNGGRPCLGSRP